LKHGCALSGRPVALCQRRSAAQVRVVRGRLNINAHALSSGTGNKLRRQLPYLLQSLTGNSSGRLHTIRHSAKAGIQGAEIGAPALDPRLRGGDDEWSVILGPFSVRYSNAVAII
jgi:hypothetical protein